MLRAYFVLALAAIFIWGCSDSGKLEGESVNSDNAPKEVIEPEKLTIVSPDENQMFKNNVVVMGECTTNRLTGDSILISGDLSENEVIVECESGSFEANIILSPGDGDKVITAELGEITDQRTITKDSTAPALNFVSPPENSNFPVGTTIVGTCESGRTVDIKGSGLATGQRVSCLSGRFEAQIDFSTNNGPKTVEIEQTDAIGNKTTMQRVFERLQLSKDSLLARYFLDEAVSGQAPTEIKDSAPNPLNLGLNYGGGILNFIMPNPNQRGLSWSSTSGNAGACGNLANTKLYDGIHNGTAATIEAIVNISQVQSSGSRIFDISPIDRGTWNFSLGGSHLNNNRTMFGYRDVNDNNHAEFDLNLTAIGRSHIVLILDSTEANANDRLRLYHNGNRINRLNGAVPNLNQQINLSGSREICIGNRQSNGSWNRSPRGTIHYIGVYSKALSNTEIAENLKLLMVNDDYTP